MKKRIQNPQVQLVLLLALSAVLFFANTWGYDLWPPDEPRFGQVAREMMQTHDFLSPHINGLPYKEKPPLLFWTIAAISAPFGDVNEFTARAPSGIAALIAIWLTYLLASRLYDRRVGIWAGLILATTGLFWWEARSSRTDMLLTAAMTAALYAFWRWREARQGRWLLALYTAIAVGLFAKGPPALIFPALLFIFFYWKRGEERRGLHWAIGLVAAAIPVLCWFVCARLQAAPVLETPGHSSGMGGELVSQTLGRFILGGSKAAWPWMYLEDLPMDLIPWTLFLPWVALWAWKRRKEDERMRLLVMWTAPAFIFFSICIGKRDIYLLPIYPALAILFARGMLDLMEGDHALWRHRTAKVFGAALFLPGLVGLILVSTKFHEFAGTSVFFVPMILLGGFAFSPFPRFPFSPSLHKTVAVSFAALAFASAWFVFPQVDTVKGASDFCRPLRHLSEAHKDYRLYTVGFSREEYIFYCKHPHTPILTDLLPVNLSHPISFTTMAKGQIALKKAIAKAVEKVPVASITAPTDAEIQALRAALHEAVEKTKVDPELARAFEQSLTATINKIALEFNAPTPAFMFIMQEDWKWLVPIFPNLARHKIIAQESIGRRNMFLIANDAGTALAGDARPLSRQAT